jgi:hypothetical protein
VNRRDFMRNLAVGATAVATRCVAQPKSDNLDVSPHTAVLYKVELA